jgi:hypothetical protein
METLWAPTVILVPGGYVPGGGFAGIVGKENGQDDGRVDYQCSMSDGYSKGTSKKKNEKGRK